MNTNNEDTHEYVLVKSNIEIKGNNFYETSKNILCEVTKDNYISKIRESILNLAIEECKDKAANYCKSYRYKNRVHNIYVRFEVFPLLKKTHMIPLDSQPIFTTMEVNDMKKVFEHDVKYVVFGMKIEYETDLNIIMGSYKDIKYAIIFPQHIAIDPSN